MSAFVMRIAAVAAISLGALLAARPARADVPPPPGKRILEKCHKLETAEFGDYVLLGAVETSPTSPPGTSPSFSRVPVNKCLPMGYRANFMVVAMKKSEWQDKASGGSYTFSPLPEHATIKTDSTYLDRTVIDASDPLKRRTIIYRVAAVKGSNVILYPSQIIDEYSDGRPSVKKDLPRP